jgi:hypothetical protein
MIDDELDPYVEWIAREARRPVQVDAAARTRLMDAIRAEPRPHRRRFDFGRLLEPRSFALSPLTSGALAAGLVGIGLLLGLWTYRGGRSPAGSLVEIDALHPPVHDTVRLVRFVLVAPNATQVSLVGDFNEWSETANLMTRTPTGNAWSIAVPLTPGRHVYAFVINGSNGTQWVADPTAPLAPEDAFGVPNSVVLVGGSSS